MAKEMKQVEEVKETQPQETTIQDASIEQLKVAAFDVEQQIKELQRNYQVIINELQSRMEKQ